MDAQHFVDSILASAIGAYWWFTKTLYNRQSALEAAVAAQSTEVAKTYATRDDMARIEAKLDRILERLSQHG